MLLSIVLLLGVTPARAESPRPSDLEALRNSAVCFKKPFHFKSSDLQSDAFTLGGEIPFPGKSKKYRCWMRTTRANSSGVDPCTDPDFPVLKTRNDNGMLLDAGSAEYRENFAEYEKKIDEYWKKPGRDHQHAFSDGVFRREGPGRFPTFDPKVLSAEDTAKYLAWVKAGKPKKEAKKWATVRMAPADPGESDPGHYVKATEAFYYRAEPTAALVFPLEMKPVATIDQFVCRAKTSGVDVSEMTASDFVEATGGLLSIAALQGPKSSQGKVDAESTGPRVFRGEKKLKPSVGSASRGKGTKKKPAASAESTSGGN